MPRRRSFGIECVTARTPDGPLVGPAAQAFTAAARGRTAFPRAWGCVGVRVVSSVWGGVLSIRDGCCRWTRSSWRSSASSPAPTPWPTRTRVRTPRGPLHGAHTLGPLHPCACLHGRASIIAPPGPPVLHHRSPAQPLTRARPRASRAMHACGASRAPPSRRPEPRILRLHWTLDTAILC